MFLGEEERRLVSSEYVGYLREKKWRQDKVRQERTNEEEKTVPVFQSIDHN